MAKISARGDREFERVKFEDGVHYILTEQGRILLRDPWGHIKLLMSAKEARNHGSPREIFNKLVSIRARHANVSERR